MLHSFHNFLSTYGTALWWVYQDGGTDSGTQRLLAVSEPALPSFTQRLLLSVANHPPYHNREQHNRNRNRKSGLNEESRLWVIMPMDTRRAHNSLPERTWAWQYTTFTSFWWPSNITRSFHSKPCVSIRHAIFNGLGARIPQET